jgi:hypothetical protein
MNEVDNEDFFILPFNFVQDGEDVGQVDNEDKRKINGIRYCIFACFIAG